MGNIKDGLRPISLRCYARWIVNVLIGASMLMSCETIKQSSKYQFNEGYYRSTLSHKRRQLLYIVPADDSIKVYFASNKKNRIDTTRSTKIAFPLQSTPVRFEKPIFKRNTFDIDVLSVLFKYRPSVDAFPNQFNATFNGAVYTGLRSDIYKLSYSTSPLGLSKRIITHYGYSFGIFTGFGTARIDEYVTQNAINIEYDGFVNLTGIAAIIGIDKVSFGLLIGEDTLLDKNRKYWVNENKPWIGASIGLNLN